MRANGLPRCPATGRRPSARPSGRCRPAPARGGRAAEPPAGRAGRERHRRWSPGPSRASRQPSTPSASNCTSTARAARAAACARSIERLSRSMPARWPRERPVPSPPTRPGTAADINGAPTGTQLVHDPRQRRQPMAGEPVVVDRAVHCRQCRGQLGAEVGKGDAAAAAEHGLELRHHRRHRRQAAEQAGPGSSPTPDWPGTAPVRRAA